METGFYQIGDFTATIHYQKREVESTRWHPCIVTLNICYNQNDKWNTYIKLFMKLKKIGFTFGDDNLECFSKNENAVRASLQRDSWVLTENRTLEQKLACVFFYAWYFHEQDENIFIPWWKYYLH